MFGVNHVSELGDKVPIPGLKGCMGDRERNLSGFGNRSGPRRRLSRVVNERGSDMNNTIDFAPFEAPVLDERPWTVFSACREADPTIFFASTRGDERAAVRVCGTCTVRDECLEFALETRERFGVWGGATERERKRMMRA